MAGRHYSINAYLAEINDILARQDLNRQKRITSNKRIWAKQAELGRKGKTHHGWEKD